MSNNFSNFRIGDVKGIIRIAKGQSKNIHLTFRKIKAGELYSIEGIKIFFTVKKDINSEQILISKTTDDPTQIEFVKPREGTALLHIQPIDIQLLDVGEYVYDVWVELPNNEIFPVTQPILFEVIRGVK